MKISQRGIDLIKKFEGCKLTAYKDPAGVWTIGHGHTAGVKQGDEITQEEAEELLKRDLAIYEDKVMKYDSKYHWNQNQFDALVSFAYNIGNIDQLTSNGRRAIKTISDKILEYNKAGGKKLEGLVKRRKAEKQLFDTEVETSTPIEEKPQEKPQTSSERYIVGKTYTVSVKSALNVRKGAGKENATVGYNGLTPDGKKHANRYGALLNGTKVTCQEVKTVGDSVWLKIPSGWICGKEGNNVFVK